MSYYDYHAVTKRRIRSGELVTTYRADNYPRIGRALVLVFSTTPVFRPIRPEREPEYKPILDEWRRQYAKGSADRCPA